MFPCRGFGTAARQRIVLIPFNRRIPQWWNGRWVLGWEHVRRGKGKPADACRVGGRKEDAMTTQASGGLDFEVLRQAIEGRDAETLVGLYADDAEVITVNRSSTP